MLKGKVGVLLAVLLGLCAARTQAAVFSADAVKAAFLYRFASYVEWPPDAPSATSAPFVIAVAGDDGVARQLDALLPRMSVHGQPVEVRRVTRASDLDGVRILYVGPGPMTRTRSLRAAAASRPVLLVTDDQDGIKGGGVINFIESNRNVRFEISLLAADRARLRIDSALLSVAASVERRPQVSNDRGSQP